MTSDNVIDETSFASSEGSSHSEDTSVYGGVRLSARTAGTAFKIERNLQLDRMFGGESSKTVTSPRELWIDPDLIEFGVDSTAAQCRLSVDASWQIEQEQAVDFARWFTGHSAPPANFVTALSKSSNYLRVAISKETRPLSQRALRPKIVATQRAAKEILRCVRGITAHKNKAERNEKWSTATKELERLHGSSEVLYGLFLGEPIQFRCEYGGFVACLKKVNNTRINLRDAKAELAPVADRFVADLEYIVNLAKAFKKHQKKLPKNRMTATPSEGVPHHWEEQRLKEARSWTAELFCAATILAVFSWRDPQFILPCEKWEACEDFWVANGGRAHRGKDDPVYKIWDGYLDAAKRTVGGVWRLLECDFGPGPFRSFDAPVSIPKSLRDNGVRRKGCKRTRKSNRVDLLTLEETKRFIDRLSETDREKKSWRDAKVAVDSALTGTVPTRLARERLERALNNPDQPARSWYVSPPQSESLHPGWVVTVKNELREYLKAGGSNAAEEVAKKFHLKAELAEQLAGELNQEKLGSSA